MIPVDNFYNTLYANLLFNTSMRYFLNFTISPGPTDVYDNQGDLKIGTLFIDQEPLFLLTVDQLLLMFVRKQTNITIFANSEISELKDQIVSQFGYYDWYYFYHGFAALDWYRDYKYFPKSKFKFDKVFMSLNHIVTTDRSYRLNLVANYMQAGILDKGIVSLPIKGIGTELFSQDSKLSKEAKRLVFDYLMPLDKPLIADTEFPEGYMSAATDFDFQRRGFWHVVAETVFYYKKLHLTEKIFKPIIARRPFLLVAAPGNLAYLRSYGFKTFSKWVDESYDDEQDDDKRIQMVVAQLKKLCALNKDELYEMQQEMDEILDYNFEHFYHGNFQRIIVDEMLDNFKKLPIPHMQDIDFDAVRTRFLR